MQLVATKHDMLTDDITSAFGGYLKSIIPKQVVYQSYCAYLANQLSKILIRRFKHSDVKRLLRQLSRSQRNSRTCSSKCTLVEFSDLLYVHINTFSAGWAGAVILEEALHVLGIEA